MAPDWRPLFDLAPEYLDEFMWMHSVELENGSHLQAYKHRWTRLYVYLDGDGRAFYALGLGRLQEGDPHSLVAEARNDS